MKLSANSVLTAMCLALSSGAMAAPSVDVAIKGWVKPGACDITSAGKSVRNIDLGSFFTAYLNEDEQTIFEPFSVGISVRCMTKTKFSIVVSDNRAAFVVDGAKPSPLWDESYHFGLGAGQAGNYILLVNSRAFDLWLGGDWATLHSEDSGATWERRSEDRTAFKPATTHRIAFAKDQEMVPSAIAYARVGIAPVVAIRKTSSLDLSSQIVIDGSASFTLHYD